MSWAVTAIGVSAAGSFISGQQQAEAQREANEANERISLAGIGEQRRQFGLRGGVLSESRRAREDLINRQQQGRFDTQVSERLDPFATAGREALTERQALLGLSGGEAQQSALSRISESPGQTFLRDRQTRALLRNQAAIGGLGGGNVRTALQEQAFGRAQTDIDRQIERLGGVAQQGLTAAQGGVGGPGFIQTGADIGVLPEDLRKVSEPGRQPTELGAVGRAAVQALQSGEGGNGGGEDTTARDFAVNPLVAQVDVGRKLLGGLF